MTYPPPPPPPPPPSSVTLQGRYPYGVKNKLVYVLLAFFLGGWGVHYFYIGNTGKGVVMIILFVASCIFWIPWIILIILTLGTAIRALTRSDQDFYEQYICQSRWM